MAFQTGDRSSDFMNDPLNIELWNACVGPLVTLPEKEELAYYFPEGHLEQIEASTGQVLEQEIPSYNLPSKLLCKVTDLVRMTELESDDVYAKLNLKPLENQSEPIASDVPVPKPAKCTFQLFTKRLNASDADIRRGSLFVHRKHANPCLPALNDSPWQELIATDLHNNEWPFRHDFKGKELRHLFTRGWKEFLHSKKLVAGDSFILISGEDKRDIRVGVRKVVSHQVNRSSSLMLHENMHNGVLANVANAVRTRSEFPVIFHPRTMKSEFTVNVKKYKEAKNRNWSVGMRFTMRFEGEDGQERRFSGTIVGVKANESSIWHNSEWRTLKVQWDEAGEPSSIIRPDRVSAWDIEPLVPNVDTSSSQSQPPQGNKRPKPSSTGLQLLSEVALLSPSAKTTDFGESSGSALSPIHVDNGAEPFAKFGTAKKQAHKNSIWLFGVEIVEKSNADDSFPFTDVSRAAAIDDLVVPEDSLSKQLENYTKAEMLEHIFGKDEDVNTQEDSSSMDGSG